VLAFIPNIGALISGSLMVAVGFSAGANHGLWAIAVYFFVHNFEGYVVLPYVARRTVDLAPAVLLAMQLLMGALFGILGVLFADPILAMLKVILVDLSRQEAERQGDPAAIVGNEPSTGPEPVAVPASAAAASAAPASAGASPRRRARPSERAPQR
jgi:predicted PurR-regulated permease PerM